MIEGYDGVRHWRGILAVIALLLGVAVLATAPTMGLAAMGAPGSSGTGPVTKVGNDSLTAPVGPIVGTAQHSDTSPPLRSIRPVLPDRLSTKVEENENPFLPGYGRGLGVADRVVQKLTNPFAMPTPMANFDGMYNYWGPIPPDTNGDVASQPLRAERKLRLRYILQDRMKLYGPTNTNALWTGFGGSCEARNDGDPINLYDPLADRWMISQFTSASPYYQCIAVSTSGDPLGTYYRYAFLESATIFGDYPHLGVWPDGYYMTVNQFNGGSGGGNYVFERPRMLRGQPECALRLLQHR